MPDSLPARIAHLEDAEEIRNLIASYGPLADRGDAEGVARLWVADGEYDVGGHGVARGHAAIAALIDGATHRELMAAGCAHILSPHRIALAGDRATAEGYSMVVRCTPDGFEPWRVSANRWRFARQADGGWRITQRINRPIAPRRP